MATAELSSPKCRAIQFVAVVRTVTVIMGAVVRLTFLFGFGNVLNLALHLGNKPTRLASGVRPRQGHYRGR